MPETIDTSGFYKKNTDGTWLYAKEEVVAPSYEISVEDYDGLGLTIKNTGKSNWIYCQDAPTEYKSWRIAEDARIANSMP